jgi:molybdopterin-binding protein
MGLGWNEDTAGREAWLTSLSYRLPAVKQLKSLRLRLNLSQRQLGELLGVHVMTVSKWERGVLEPSEHQKRIVRALADAAENGLRATPPARGRKHDPIQFLAAALSQAYGGPQLDLGALSATNRFAGRIVEIARGDVMSKVVVEITPKVRPSVRIGAVITTDSVDRLRLEVGSRAVAIIKATEVIVGGG